MALRKRQETHSNHERWLVSYADFITLLFAFFVVMFASSQADKGRAKQVSDSVKKALEQSSVPPVLAQILGGTVTDKGRGNAQMKGPGGQPAPPAEQQTQKMAELRPFLDSLTAELQQEVKAGKMDINLDGRGLIISLKQAAFFPSGGDTISPEVFESLGKVARVIQKIPNPVRLEGHTDSLPIKSVRFRNNWELSAARGVAVLEVLHQQFGVPLARMAIVGYADTIARSSNETEEGRALNRRVDVVILSPSESKREATPVAWASPPPRAAVPEDGPASPRP